MKRSKRFFSSVAAGITALACLPLNAAAVPQESVSSMTYKESEVKTSTVYVGEVTLDGSTAFSYLYSDDLTFNGTVLKPLYDGLSVMENSTFADFIAPYTRLNSDEIGFGFCTNAALQDQMDASWKSAENAAKAVYPDKTVNHAWWDDTELAYHDGNFEKYCQDSYYERQNNNSEIAGEITDLTVYLDSHTESNVWYENGDGVEIRHVDTTVIYDTEVIKVKYTTASVLTRPSYQFMVLSRDYDDNERNGKVSAKYDIDEPNPYNIESSSGEEYSTGDMYHIYKGIEVTLNAKAEEGYQFKGWYRVDEGTEKMFSGDPVSTESTYAFYPGETVAEGDIEPLWSLCAVFEKIPEHVHSTVIHVEAVQPTCYEGGNAEYWKCEDCGKLYLDETLTEETTLEEVTYGPEHQYALREGHDPSCEEKGWITHLYCAVCGTYAAYPYTGETIDESEVYIDALDHDWGEWQVIKIENGYIYKQRVCKRDGTHYENRMEPVSSYHKGDVDHSGQVDYIDVAMLTSAISREISIPENSKSEFDYDGNGQVDYIDLAMLIDFINK